jgi:hypothetical protein
MTFHAFITELLCRTNSKVIIEKFPHLRQTTYERLIQTLGEVESGKVFRRIFWIPGEYCTILTIGSQGVTCDGCEHYWTKFTGEN